MPTLPIAENITEHIPAQRRHTPEEYLALEDVAESRSEYRNGEIIPMTGGTTNHNRIARNLSAWLHLAAKDSDDFENFIGDVKLWIPNAQIYTYPDVMVVTGAVECHNQRADIICNPKVIIEVLSNSTEEYDRLGKFNLYRSIPSFQEYVLINQTRVQVEHYTKQTAKRWMLQDLDPEDEQVQFASIPFAISLHDLYCKVQFNAL